MMKSEKEFLKKLGLRIREIRTEKGWTLEQVEEKGFPSWRHFQKIEAGKNCTIVTLHRICKVLHVSMAEIFEKI